MAGAMTTSAHRGSETPTWLLRFFDWFGGLVNGKGSEMNPVKARKRDLESRFDTIGWGLLFLLFAALAMPNGSAEYAAIAAVGGAMLLLNVVRRLLDVEMRWFSLVLGGALFIAGCGALSGMHMDAFVLFFVLAGVVNIAAAIVRPRPATA
jgi:hypothetical protein